MRVLHLIDAASPQATATTLAMVAESLGQADNGPDHLLLLLGGDRLKQAAASGGVKTAAVASVPYGKALLGWSALRRYARQHEPFDLIHCWSIGSLSAAAMTFSGVPRLLTLTVKPNHRAAAWLKTLSREARSRTVLLPTSSTNRQALLSAGVPEPIVHVLRPPVNLGRLNTDDRAALRSQWEAEANRVKILALLGDDSDTADSTTVGTAMILTACSQSGTDLDLRLLVHPNKVNRPRLARVFAQMGLATSVIQEPRLAEPWSVLPGCDLALAMGDHGGGLSLLWAMAGNIPIIAEANYAASEIVEDHHSALLTQPQSANSIAHRMTQLFSDPQLAWKLRDTARHEAYSFFSCRQYRESLGIVYQQMVNGTDIQVPLPEASGGLRFAGRA